MRQLAEKMRKKILRGAKSINITPDQIKKARRFLSDEMKRNGKVTVDYSFETGRLNEESIDVQEYQRRIKHWKKFQNKLFAVFR